MCFATYSQQISVHSPTAANLGLYGEIPVSYFTGTPNISIPLYEIKGKQINVPVRLTYHPAGIRPEIHPGPVGLGWSLQAGGVISRTVRGNGPDEGTYNQSGVEGYLYYALPSGWIAQSNWKDNAKNSMETDCFACRNAVHYMAPYSDFEPDEFSFSVMDISGKFYFDHTGQIQVQCDNPVKVIFNNEFIESGAEGIRLNYSYSNSSRAFKSFTIIDEQGTQYFFGGATAIEFSDPISYGRGADEFGIPATGQLLQATSWFLTQIKPTNGTDIINFEYERGPFVSQLYRSYNYYYYSGAGMSGWQYNSIAKDGTLISPVYLKRISVVNGEDIELTYSQSNDIKYTESDYCSIFSYPTPVNAYKLLEMTSAIPRFQPIVPSNKYDRIQWLKLDDISIKCNSEPIKQINFVYNNNSSERLFLDSLKVYGNNTLLAPSINYTFTYKNRNRLPAQYLTCITDHWGFNNGKTYPSNGFNSQNKVPDAYYTDSGVLSEIHYPTGGSVQFEYELHDYAKIVNTKNRSLITNQSGLASGLRIKKITSDNLIREFFYKETPTSSISSGILNVLPQYTFSINGTDCDDFPFSMAVTRSMPVIPLAKENEGLFIGYTYVCEQISSGNGGYTQYYYSNHDNGHSDVLLSNGLWHRDIFPSDPHCSRYFERGRLKKETSFNAGGQAIASTETFWNRYGSQGESNPRAFLFEGIKIGYDYCSSAAYLHFCYKLLPSQKTEMLYDLIGQNPVTTTTKYKYNSYKLLSEKEIVNSDGTVSLSHYQYYLDKYFPQGIQNDPIGVKIRDSHMLNALHRESLFKQEAEGAISHLVKSTRTDYDILYNIIKPSSIYTLNLDSPIEPSPVQSELWNYDYQKDIEFKYDSKGNVIETITKDGLTTAYIWSYKHQYPVAEIKNATYSEVINSLTPNLLHNLITYPNYPTDAMINAMSNSLKSNLPQALVTTYTYKPLVGMTSKTDPRGVTTYYEYDTFNRLKRTYIKENGVEKTIQIYDYHYKQ